MSSMTTHPDQASSRLLISSHRDSLLLLVIWKETERRERRERTQQPGGAGTNLAVAVGVSGLLPQPVDGVEVLVGAHVGKWFVQEVHEVSSSVHLLGGRGAADA